MSESFKIFTDPGKFSEQEQTYLELREKEGRIYNDEQVRRLPEIPPNHPLAFEWKVRKRSSEKLLKYLDSKNQSLRILEIGCGNGWLSHAMSKIKDADVTGVDINIPELEQAARVFKNQKNLQFGYADIFETSFENRFDIIVIASAIQYFPSPVKSIDRLLGMINKNGEIHILDSPLYKSEKESGEAHERSAAYFRKQGASSMSQYYFHHSRLFLKRYNFRLIKPSLLDWMRFSASFPWVIICNS
jgi:2-polyprenyl-3-methyl-5-hydroxy-6-metoxy-1,4-benzoquinol methylase